MLLLVSFVIDGVDVKNRVLCELAQEIWAQSHGDETLRGDGDLTQEVVHRQARQNKLTNVLRGSHTHRLTVRFKQSHRIVALEIAELRFGGLDDRCRAIADIRERPGDGVGEELLDLFLDGAHATGLELENGHLGRGALLWRATGSRGGSTALVLLACWKFLL